MRGAKESVDTFEVCAWLDEGDVLLGVLGVETAR